MRIVDTIYASVLDAIMRECEPSDDWLKCNRQECVEARALLIYFLYKHGLSRSQISNKTGFAKSSVVNHLNEFDAKIKSSKIMQIQKAQIEQELNKG